MPNHVLSHFSVCPLTNKVTKRAGSKAHRVKNRNEGKTYKVGNQGTCGEKRPNEYSP